MQISYQSFPNSPPTANMSKVQSPILTPQLTPSVTGYINTKLWDERPAKYAANVLKHVCIFLLILTACEEVTSFAIGQSLKNFFQKLGWSNKGSTSMKLTYDSFSQFMCIVAGYIADERLGKFKTLLSAATLDSFGLLFLVIAALPVIVNNHLGVSKAIFNIGLFLGVAVSQICLRSLVISYGGDQFSPNSPPSEKALFFSIQYWVANIGAFIGYAVFPSVSIHGFGAIPAEYGYVSVYLVGFVMLVIFVGLLWYTRRRYVDVPPTKESIALVIKIVINHAKKNFSAQMVVLGTVLYIAAFLLNILASILSDHGEVGHNISYACGVMIVIATILWVYFGQSSEFMESAKDTVGGHFDSELVDGVKQVIRILPFNAFNVFWWVCQNQRGNNQSIVQQTDTRLGSGPFATQMPGPTVQMFNPIGVLIFVPLMERVIYPLYEKHAGKPASRYGKVLAGYCTAVVAMIWTGCYEIIRRSTSPLTYVDSNGVTQFMINDDGNQVMNDIPWWTAIPQYLLVALAGVMIAIPSYDINYSEVPQSMRSTSIALGFFVNSMGSTLLSIIVLLFGKYIPANLNNGNIEYMFFTLAAIMVVNIFFYVIVMNKMQLGMIPRVKKTGEKTDEAQPGTVLTTGFQGIMAWVNRTTRDNCPGGLQVKAGTSAYVGPGYYETSQSRHVRPNATGFGSGEKLVRGENAGSTKGLTMVTPGPGTYTTNNQTSWQSPTKSKASATSIFQSKSQRLDEIKLRRGYSTPGPGAYTKQDSFTKKAKTHTSLGNPLVRTPPSNNKIRWTRLPTAPSIPTVSQSFGYEQGAYGKLIRHEPTKVGHTGCGNDTLGPGEYEPMKGLKSINKTRTTDFSKGKVTRFIEHEVRSKADVPGPGEYTNTGDATALKDPKRISAVFKSLTREQAAPTTTKNVPGPGAYHPNQSHGFTTETKPEHLQFFGSTSTRFEATQRDALVPGPGAYYYAPGNSQQPRSVPSRKKAPFSSKKERFEAPKEKDQCLAAPGSYEVPSAVSEVLNKVTSRVTNFGSTTRRFDTISSGVPYSRESLESQLERDMKAQEAESQKQGQSSKKRQQPKASSMFASSTSRPHQTQKATGPSPGDYEIRRSWNAAGAQGAFKSGIDRMKDKPNPTAFVPGPGSYSTDRLGQKSHHKARPNVFYAAEPRFKDKLPKVPVLGPGQYNTETIESDWNRPTHNISIATEMEFAMMH